MDVFKQKQVQYVANVLCSCHVRVLLDRSRCAISNGISYYLIFVTLLWNAVEALTMYLLLVQVFHADISHYAVKTCLLAWGEWERVAG